MLLLIILFKCSSAFSRYRLGEVKQFLDRLDKPDVDAIEGLSPAVAIEQRNPTRTNRSTVGTATEVYDYLRLLYARVGRTVCPECDREVRPDTVTRAVDALAALAPGTRLVIAFPLARSGRVSHDALVRNLRAMGFVRAQADGEIVELDDLAGGGSAPDLAKADSVRVVVDRVKVPAVPSADWSDRLADSLAACFREGEGEAVVLLAGNSPPPENAPAEDELRFTERFRCPRHPDTVFLQPQPRLFSFNNPFGSCPECTGFGETLEYDPDLIVPNPGRSLEEGAVDPWAKPRYERERDALRRFAAREGVSGHVPWRDLPADFRNGVLCGKGPFQGVMDFLASKESKRRHRYIRVFLRRYQRPTRCSACGGSRLRPEASWVRVGGRDVGAASEMPLEALLPWLEALELRPSEARVAATILKELSARLRFLVDVGLGYLTLGRRMRTLSGGEAQRIALANSLGSRLVDTLYVLDEPTIGLHARDADALMSLLARLRDAGNTVVVVEHAVAAIRAADHVVELGPASGDAGGELVFEGSPDDLVCAATETGRYLSVVSGESEGAGEASKSADVRKVAESAAARRNGRARRPVGGPRIRLEGAALHNLPGVDAEFPVGAMTVVTGVSGSGKSTLVHDVLYRAFERELGAGETSAREHLGEPVGAFRSISGLEHVAAAVLVDQSPIGRTPRSNPVTYVQAWGEVRRIFAGQRAARSAGLTARSFSFNVEGGRCEACKGAGYVEVEMVFMADVHVPCDLCMGKRYRPEVLQVKVRDKNVHDVLGMTVDRAMRFFIRERKLGQALWQLQQAGLGYLRLGQPANTLSGGEAQRLKIARELIGATRRAGRKAYILDEPTTGLSGTDVGRLLAVLDRLVDAGNTLVVVEHDLDVAAAADWVVDMGPGAGEKGGRVVAMGRPEAVAATPDSVTGRFLRQVLAR